MSEKVKEVTKLFGLAKFIWAYVPEESQPRSPGNQAAEDFAWASAVATACSRILLLVRSLVRAVPYASECRFDRGYDAGRKQGPTPPRDLQNIQMERALGRFYVLLIGVKERNCLFSLCFYLFIYWVE